MSLYDASNGSAGDGRFYSLGTSADRALGGVGHGIFGYPGDRATNIVVNTVAGWIAASFTNSTGSALNAFTAMFNGEQWSDAGDNEPPYPQVMGFQYGFGDSFTTVGTWVSPGASFDFTSPVFTTTNQPIDGNGIGRVANLGGTISDLTWDDGETLWLRWVERNDLVFDHAMAIDNFSFTAAATVASAVPESGTATIYGIICCVIAMTWGRRAVLEFFSGDFFAKRKGVV